MTKSIAEAIEMPNSRLSLTESVPRAENGLLASSMDLTSWTGDMTMFDGFYNTLPVADYREVDWATYSHLLAAEQPTTPTDKSRARYFVPSLLRQAAFIGETKAKAARLGLPLIGKQRSSEHVIEAGCVVAELDGIDDAEFCRIEQTLQGQGITYLMYSTYSHGKLGKTGTRARIVIPMDRPLAAKDYALAASGLNRLVLSGNADQSGFKLCQQQGVWATSPERVNLAFKRQHLAGVASASALIASAPTAPPRKSVVALSELPVIFDRDRVRAVLDWISPENYDDWIAVGLWLKAAYGDPGFPIWVEWSDTASDCAKEKNNGSAYSPDKKWSDIDPRMPSEAGAGMLFGAAKLRALDAVRRGCVTGHWAGKAKQGLVYLRLYHPGAYQELVGGSV